MAHICHLIANFGEGTECNGSHICAVRRVVALLLDRRFTIPDRDVKMLDWWLGVLLLGRTRGFERISQQSWIGRDARSDWESILHGMTGTVGTAVVLCLSTCDEVVYIFFEMFRLHSERHAAELGSEKSTAGQIRQNAQGGKRLLHIATV